MSDKIKTSDAAIGFRVKSGRAVVVLIAGSKNTPEIIDSRTILLSDPSLPETKQPYHSGFGKLEEDKIKLNYRKKIIKQVTKRSLSGLIKEYNRNGFNINNSCLVVGSLVDPDSITNPHIKAHALEGKLFRSVIQQEILSKNINCSFIVEKLAYPQGVRKLKISQIRIKKTITGLGHKVKGPWRSDEKYAALAAWISLS